MGDEMPITYSGKKYKKFANLVRKVMKEKGWSKERAGAYVAVIERRQKGEQ
jgi:hypothetical protein